MHILESNYICPVFLKFCFKEKLSVLSNMPSQQTKMEFLNR